MTLDKYIFIGIILLAVLNTIPIFINTIITKKWRNRVPNESDYWKWEIIYYSPTDKRIFLPKRTGLGITLNFAQPISIILIVLFFIIILTAIINSFAK